MKIPILVALLIVAWPSSAEEPIPKKQDLAGWGIALDPAGDCTFDSADGKLTITVPGTERSHDLSTELESSTAPRVVQPVIRGDFRIQVRIDGKFQPGVESTQVGRSSYTGAGLVVMADQNNFVRLERATLHRPGGEARPYVNFEIRVDGKVERLGTIGEFVVEKGKSTWLRLERKGQQMLGAMSHDGEQWTEGEPKELRADAWNGSGIVAGVAAISTSRQTFVPTFSSFSIEKGTHPITGGAKSD